MGSQAQPTSDHIHHTTERLYKDLTETFAPRLKNFLQTGRAYQKALMSVSAAAKAHIDSIGNLGYAAEQANGASKDVGTSLIQLAEVHKEIQKQVEENIKAFNRDLIIPLETKQDSEFKNLSLEHKKYLNGHKLLVNSYDKATSNLKKVRRKNKTKGFGQDAKEMQCLRLADECRTKMDSFRLRALKKIMLEERKRYCYLLDRSCAMVRCHASHHSKSQEMLTHRLQEWSALYKDPTQLPENAENLLALSNEEKMFQTLDDRKNHNSITDLRQNNVDNLHREPVNPNTYDRLPNGRPRSLSELGDTRSNGTGTTLPRSITVPPPPPPSMQPHVRALYDHPTTADNQLSFNMGDIVRLIGDKKDGWHYGENTKNHKMGWFPLSFTEPFDTNQRNLSQRAKSMVDLLDTPEDDPIITTLPPSQMPPGFHGYGSVDPRSRTMPTTRPMTTHEPAAADDSRSYTLQRQNTAQQQMSQWADYHVVWSGYNQRPNIGPPRPHTIYEDTRFSNSFGHSLYGSNAPPWQAPPPPPLTGPPSIVNSSSSSQLAPNTGMDNRPMYASSPVQAPYSNLPPPPPPFDNPTTRGNHYTTPPSLQQGSHYAESPVVAGGSPYASVNVNTSQGQYLPRYTEAPGSVHSPPLPPPPPVVDYEEDDIAGSNMFSNVRLKKTATNDRSAPRIN